MGERADRAEKLFREGYNCAQAVLLAFADKYNLPLEVARKISVSFGAGMGRLREVCGTVSGMLMVAGLEGDEARGRAEQYTVVQDLVAAFKKANGTIYCKELLGLKATEIGSAVPEKRTAEYYQKRPCVKLVRFAAEELEKRFGE